MRTILANQKQFLKHLLQVIDQQLQLPGAFLVKFKLLLLIHIIISSQIARAEFSKLLITTKLTINSTTNVEMEQKIGQICHQYYLYIYKLAAQTTLINEELNKPQDDLMIYFTLANQCYIGMNMEALVTPLLEEQNALIASLVKFVYFDIQDIYIFILKDVKYLVEKSPHLIKNKSQLVELYKECQTLQEKMLKFYKFNMNFTHINLIMPPHSISIKSNLISQIVSFQSSESLPQGSNNKHHPKRNEIKSISYNNNDEKYIKEPLTAKNSQTNTFRFPTRRPMSPTNGSLSQQRYFKAQKD